MKKLPLGTLETGHKEVENLELTLYLPHLGSINLYIKRPQVKCSNEKEIMESIARRAEQYFDQVERKRGSHVKITEQLTQKGILTCRPTVHTLADDRKEIEKNLKNTMDDVFGVKCKGEE